MTDNTPQLDAPARHTLPGGAPGRQGETAPLPHAPPPPRLQRPARDRSEPLLFGIGGGIGMATMSFDKHGKHLIYLGTRYHTKETDRPEFLGAICERLGIRFDVTHASSDDAAGRRLRGLLAAEPHAAPVVWVDAGRLPYRGAPGSAIAWHTVAVAGESGDAFIVSDMSRSMPSISAADLRAARATTYAPRRRVAGVAAGGPEERRGGE